MEKRARDRRAGVAADDRSRQRGVRVHPVQLRPAADEQCLQRISFPRVDRQPVPSSTAMTWAENYAPCRACTHSPASRSLVSDRFTVGPYTARPVPSAPSVPAAGRAAPRRATAPSALLASRIARRSYPSGSGCSAASVLSRHPSSSNATCRMSATPSRNRSNASRRRAFSCPTATSGSTGNPVRAQNVSRTRSH